MTTSSFELPVITAQFKVDVPLLSTEDLQKGKFEARIIDPISSKVKGWDSKVSAELKMTRRLEILLTAASVIKGIAALALFSIAQVVFLVSELSIGTTMAIILGGSGGAAFAFASFFFGWSALNKLHKKCEELKLLKNDLSVLEDLCKEEATVEELLTMNRLLTEQKHMQTTQLEKNQHFKDEAAKIDSRQAEIEKILSEAKASI